MPDDDQGKWAQEIKRVAPVAPEDLPSEETLWEVHRQLDELPKVSAGLGRGAMLADCLWWARWSVRVSRVGRGR